MSKVKLQHYEHLGYRQSGNNVVSVIVATDDSNMWTVWEINVGGNLTKADVMSVSRDVQYEDVRRICRQLYSDIELKHRAEPQFKSSNRHKQGL